MTTQNTTLQYTCEGGVAVISLGNPPMNVCTLAMGQELTTLLESIARDRSIRAVLMRSAIPGVFAVGGDLTPLRQLNAETLATVRNLTRLCDRVAELPQPTIAALGGTTLGAGFELALACDFRFMADGIGEIGLPEVRLGMTPGAGGTQRLPRIVGAARATEMLMKGMRYTPAQAKEFGLVQEVVPAEQLEAKALKYAQSLAAQAPLALQAIKRLIRAAFETPGSRGLELERELFFEQVQSNDTQEGIRAFLEGRKPTFTGT